MRVLAIDPGYDRLGLAIMEKEHKEKVIFSECFETSPKEDFFDRLCDVGQRVRFLISEYKVEAMAIENLFFSKNTKTALLVSEARGAIIFQAMDVGIPVFEYTPNQIKLAVTGYGKATKNEVHTMVHKLIHLEEKKRRDDEVDALAIGITFFATYKKPF